VEHELPANKPIKQVSRIPDIIFNLFFIYLFI